MKEYIINLNKTIMQKAEQLMQVVDLEISKTIYRVPKTSTKSNASSYRPWIVLGGSGAIVGALGLMVSDSAKAWQLMLTCLGTLSAGYGILQRNKVSQTPSLSINYGEIKNFYVAGAELVINKVSTQWDDYISSKNNELSNEIKTRVTDEKLCANVLFKTYYLERIKVSLMDYIKTMDNIPKDYHFFDACISSRDRFATTIKNAINTAATNQTAQYLEIVDMI